MKDISDIRVILYPGKDEKNLIVQRFLSLNDKILIEYCSNDELNNCISDARKKGYGSKEVLILKDFMGRLLQGCPGSPNMICCNYRLINTGFNCLYGCTYCYLNSYLNSFGIVQFINIFDVFNEIDNFLKGSEPGRVYRVGNGEFTDSMMMDEITGIGEALIRKFSSKTNIMLELKTKSKNIDHLTDIENKGSAVMAWSINTERNIRKYEEGSASLKERINAAKRASEAGYFLAFHFDPIIVYNGWEAEYSKLVDMLFNEIDTDKVVWISMGGFRYSPGFKDSVRDIFPDEDLTAEEMFPGIDGKLRYLKSKRVRIYQEIKGFIESHTKTPFLYLCMESSDVWEQIFGKYYATSEELEEDFSDYLRNTFL